ncbi:MAG: N-acyl-D-glucosamine 2-epimerase [Chloroflexi bacterium]|nr:N-acyl-D-glucosamine 2-epimerase [Chloroflexota bacterium]
MTSTLVKTISDTIAGYVTFFDRNRDVYGVKTPGGTEFEIKIKSNTYALMTRNLGNPWADATGRMRDMLTPGRFVFTYGVFYAQGEGQVFEAQYLTFAGTKPDEFAFEKSDWWVKQIHEIGNFYLNAQFPNGAIDYRDYRTTITLNGKKEKDNYRQETDTISRLVYGFASAYMFTGDERFLEAAEKGTAYLRDHMRFYDADEKIVYWYHGIDVHGDKEDKVFSSEFGDDYDAVPAYEQIYALAGPIQTYRITGDPRILKDAELTVSLFERFFLDTEKGGYFSHLDPITLDARSDALGANKGKKNWNSVGDHAPAYLINLYLATGEEQYAKMLEHTFDMIAEHMPNYEHSPFMQEKFHEDWSHDITHMWQQNRGVPGHNLKVAWNITRMYNLMPKEKYKWFAERIAEAMPKVTMDTQRGGWYDVMERMKNDDEELHRFAFHDRKAWWQQEQGILAYLIMNGVYGGEENLKLARESEAFYNAFFLDHDDGAVYFNVLANGLPFLVGTERFKGSHSMSGYHSTELCYLAQTYQNLLIHKQPLTLHFKPQANGFKNNILRVSPDILPPGSIKITAVEIEGKPYTNFDATGLTVTLPASEGSLRVKVTLEPA